MKKVLIYTVSILLICSVVFLTSCERIDAGHEGVLVKLYGSDRGVQDVEIVTGRVFYNPFTEDVYEFPTFVQTIDYPEFTVNAKDGSVFTVDPTLSFYVTTGMSSYIFKKYRKPLEEITETTLFNYVKDAYRIEFNKSTTDEIISNREKFENAIQSQIGNTFKKEGFTIEQMTSGLQYPPSIIKAIDEKNSAVQEAMKVENQLKIAEAQARKKIIEAEAEAKANELRQRTLSPLLIQQQFIEKWDGKTPLYGNSPTFFKNVQ